MLTSSLLMTVLLAAPNAAPTEVKLTHCVVTLIDEARVPARQQGELMELLVTEGQTVKRGERMARIYDVDAQAQFNVANFKYDQAKVEAESDIYVLYAEASRQVSEENYMGHKRINNKLDKTISDMEMREKWLIWRKSELEVKKVQQDQVTLRLKAKVAQAELDVARENVARRAIESPIDGVVVEVGRHLGEWVQEGEAIIHVQRLDHVRVEGLVSSKEANPSEVTHKKVVVTVNLAHGQTAAFEGELVFVDPNEQLGGVYGVRTEVQNRQQNGQWILRPGLEAEMTIKLR